MKRIVGKQNDSSILTLQNISVSPSSPAVQMKLKTKLCLSICIKNGNKFWALFLFTIKSINQTALLDRMAYQFKLWRRSFQNSKTVNQSKCMESCWPLKWARVFKIKHGYRCPKCNAFVHTDSNFALTFNLLCTEFVLTETFETQSSSLIFREKGTLIDGWTKHFSTFIKAVLVETQNLVDVFSR